MVGVSPQIVWAFKAHLTMGAYEKLTGINEETEQQQIFSISELDINGISNLNGTYKENSIRKIDVLKRFDHTDLRTLLTDIKIKYYLVEVSKVINSPSMTVIIRILKASKSKRLTDEMKKLPFWGILSEEKYPSLTSSQLKPFIYPFLLLLYENQEDTITNVFLEKNIRNWPLVKPDTQISDQRILEIRKKYRRAYEPWSNKEDALLDQIVKEGQNIKTLANIFQRQPGAIRNRGRSSYLHILACKTYLTMLFVTYAKTIKNRCPGGLTSHYRERK